MKSHKLISIELHLADSLTTGHVSLRLNRSGELPVVLVDPLDDSGTVVEGLWLNRDAQETVYHWTTQTPPRRHREKGAVGESESDLTGAQ